MGGEAVATCFPVGSAGLWLGSGWVLAGCVWKLLLRSLVGEGVENGEVGKCGWESDGGGGEGRE
jgi:hypothetical protein